MPAYFPPFAFLTIPIDPVTPMSRRLFPTVFIFALAAVTTHGLASDSVSAAATSRLCQHVKQRKTVYVDKTKPEIIWSDGAMFEMARTFPRELQELIATPTETRDMHPTLARMSGKTEEGWQDAKGPRSSRSQEPAVIESADGKITVRVASPYFNYLHERYPKAQLRVKGALNPVLFVVDGTVRAAVMPIAMPPAGAKKQ